jgi:hypothetical protein
VKADEEFARFVRDWAAFIERWTKRLVAQGHGSSADADDLRQAALIAGKGCEWQLPEEERNRGYPQMIANVKDAMLGASTRARARAASPRLLNNYVRTCSACRRQSGYVVAGWA